MFSAAFILLTPHVAAQIIPDNWLNPQFNQPKSAIWKHSIASYESLFGTFAADGDGGGWTAQNAWTSIAQWDHQEGTRDFYDQVKSGQDKLAADTKGGWQGIELVNEFSDDVGWAILANIQAWEAYGDEVFLNRARGAYDYILNHGFVSQAVLDAGYLKGTKSPSNTIKAECNGRSMQGGVYWVNGGNPDPNDQFQAADHPGVNAVSTGNFALAGTELCRVTKDMKYCDRSYENVWWLDRHMKSDKGTLWDGIDGQTCKVTDWQFTYNQALYFAVYAELGFLTNNQTATDIAKDAIKVALSSSVPWNSENGVIGEGKGDVEKTDDGIGFKSIMTRYLIKVLPWINDPEITQAVQEYIKIQYYALTQLDSDSKENPVNFGRNWQGPYTISTRHAQIAAMDVLNGLAIMDDTSFPAQGKGAVMVLSDKPRDEEPAPTTSAAPSPPPSASPSPSKSIVAILEGPVSSSGAAKSSDSPGQAAPAPVSGGKGKECERTKGKRSTIS